MLTVGQKIPEFSIVAAKPGFNNHEENGESAFEVITEKSFPGKWKVLFSTQKILLSYVQQKLWNLQN